MCSCNLIIKFFTQELQTKDERTWNTSVYYYIIHHCNFYGVVL